MAAGEIAGGNIDSCGLSAVFPERSFSVDGQQQQSTSPPEGLFDYHNSECQPFMLLKLALHYLLNRTEFSSSLILERSDAYKAAGGHICHRFESRILNF
ncbi:hypothetical protein [Pontibacter beigongshangensis]|uniref:hypothetical protein n=1 Tax=Pontibacter beigongshangensis TaxID=2574733 RepID=UPI00164FAD07|nr:hypothetical protein [Pontibacter beigongshangensis]